MHIPNLLTALRTLIAPLVFFAVNGGGVWPFIAFILFAFGAFTDWLDGFFARRNKTVTGFGQFADPVADKLLSGFTMAAIGVSGYASILPIAGIILRDVLVTSFRFWALARGGRILPSKAAKFKTMLEMVGICVVLIYIAVGGSKEGFSLGDAIFGMVFILAVATGADYFWKNRHLITLSGGMKGDRPDQAL